MVIFIEPPEGFKFSLLKAKFSSYILRLNSYISSFGEHRFSLKKLLFDISSFLCNFYK